MAHTVPDTIVYSYSIVVLVNSQSFDIEPITGRSKSRHSGDSSPCGGNLTCRVRVTRETLSFPVTQAAITMQLVKLQISITSTA